MNKLLDDQTLARSSVVANSAMNRERGLAGGNSYSKELGFDVLAFLRERLRERGRVAWLDLCCGSGRALVEAAEALANEHGTVEILGVDLVPMFTARRHEVPGLELREEDLSAWGPSRRYALVTCVHGLHYVGDKLGLLRRAMSWLEDDGRFVANFELSSIRLADGEPAARRVARALREAGCGYNASRRVLTAEGRRDPAWGLAYVGADDSAGPNYTGQPAVHSYYTKS